MIHALTGTRIGERLQPLLPADMPFVALQAPDLLGDFPVRTIRERAISYRDILVSELGAYSSTVHLIGYSLSGALAFELAQCFQDSILNCASLCLLDPVPFCSRPTSTTSYLMERATKYDLAFGIYARKEMNFRKAVALADISCVLDLEQ